MAASSTRWKVSTARKGYITPRGSWRPTRLHKMWYSRKYDMSPMPYSVFYRGGYAIHGTGAVKQPRPAGLAWLRAAAHGQCRAASTRWSSRSAAGNTRITVVN